MRKYKVLAIMLVMSLALTACNQAKPSNNETDSATESTDNGKIDSASDDSIDIKNTQKISDTDINLSDYHGNIEISKGGEYTLTGSLTEGFLYIKTDQPVTLNLDNATIESPEGPAIYVHKAESVTIHLEEDSQNSLSDIQDTKYETLNAVVYSKADLTLEGSGSLNVDASYQHGIRGKDNVVVSGGTYVIESALDCIHANDDLNIDGGELELQSNGDECIQSETNLNINGGDIVCASAGDAIRSEVSLVINDGKIDITQATEGIESKNTLEINGGEINITCSDDSINGANAVTVNGGMIMAYSTTNDVLDSNGSMVINGGTFYGVGLKSPEGVFDCDHNNFEINGGTLLGLGAANSQPTQGKQCTLLVNPEITDTIENITIKDSKGNVVYEYELNDYAQILSEISTELQDNAVANANASTEEEEDKDFEEEVGDAPQGNAIPEKGQKPDRGTMPEGEMPKGGKLPAEGEVPEGGQVPAEGEAPEGDIPQGDRGMGKGFSGENLSEEEMEALREEMQQRKEEMMEQRKQMSGNNFQRGGIGNGGATLFISNAKLKKGKKYTIYVNGKKIETVKMQNPVTTVGEIFSMGGRGGW